jgi:transposase InsO family protein
MMRMSKSGLLPNINSENFNTCETCIKGKMISKFFSKHWKSSDLLEVINSDICGPLRTKTHRGMEYFITFTDDYSRYGRIYHIKHKSETIEKFKEYKLEVEKQLGRSIKSLNNDRGGEYEAVDSFCKESGIRHLHTMPYKPQQNVIAERRNITLMDMTRSIMAYAELTNHFWGEALSTIAYILNRIKTKTKPLTPYEYWTSLNLDFYNLKIWGCKAYVLIPKPLRDKLASKT